VNYFLDTEFNGFHGELLSLGMVREDGSGAYYVTEAARRPVEPWVQQNVIPILWDCAFVGPRVHWDPAKIGRDIAMFLHGDPNPTVISDWPADIRYFCDVIEGPNGTMAPIDRLAFRIIRVDAYPNDLGLAQHNAFNDALALRYNLTGRKP
jgi:hypothetical protein